MGASLERREVVAALEAGGLGSAAGQDEDEHRHADDHEAIAGEERAEDGEVDRLGGPGLEAGVKLRDQKEAGDAAEDRRHASPVAPPACRGVPDEQGVENEDEHPGKMIDGTMMLNARDGRLGAGSTDLSKETAFQVP